MSARVSWMDDYQRDPAKYVRERLAALSRLDADRVALGRLQAFGATSRSARTEASSPSAETKEQK